MNSRHFHQVLALYVEDDLSPSRAEEVRQHLSECAECQQYCDELLRSQSFIKSRLRSFERHSINPETMEHIRSAVLSRINPAERRRGWAFWYAVAGIAIAVIVSASLLGQIRQARQTSADAVFVDKDKLSRPAGYREWVSVGKNVYMNPVAYREYARSGRFPEGTVMVLEIASAEAKELQASVKDSARFEGGWGYFRFTDGKAQAEQAPQTAGCLSCHQEKAETDHVFTQFYPVLRSRIANFKEML